MAQDEVDVSGVIPVDGGSAYTLGGIFTAPGDVVLFETPPRSAVDPLLAEAFLVSRPNGASKPRAGSSRPTRN